MQTDVLLLFEGFTVWLVGLRFLKQAHYIAQAGLTLLPVSQMPGLKACAPMSHLKNGFEIQCY